MNNKSLQQIIEIAHKIPFDNVGVTSVKNIVFAPDLIKLCKMNGCGNYGKCYTCPPYIGKTEDLINSAKSYNYAVAVQKTYELTDSFDFEGMQSGQMKFNRLFDDFVEKCRNTNLSFLPLGAGGCRLCKRCGIIDNNPCRYPDKAYSSLEAYAIDVSQLATNCGMKYINGKNTVTYFGAILIK